MLDNQILAEAIKARQGNKGISEVLNSQKPSFIGSVNQPSAMAGQVNGQGGSIQQALPMITSIIGKFMGGA